MRHKYLTTGVILSRTPVGEGSVLVHMLTPDLGLVRASVQGVRKPGAKLSGAVQTLCESDVMLVRGKEVWRLPNAVLAENWSASLSISARLRAGRVGSLLLRLVTGESADPSLFFSFRSFLLSLRMEKDEVHDAAECLAALRIVRALGLDDGEMPHLDFGEEALLHAAAERQSIIARINRGLSASGL